MSGNFKIARHFLPDSVCRLLVPLELGVAHELSLGVDGVTVRVGLIDANHVHGAVMFVFQVSSTIDRFIDLDQDILNLQRNFEQMRPAFEFLMIEFKFEIEIFELSLTLRTYMLQVHTQILAHVNC